MSRWRELADKRRRAHAGQISPTVMRAQPPAAADARHLQAGKTRAPNAAMPKMPELPKIESPNVFGNFGNSGAGVAAKIRGTRSLTYWPCGIARSPIGPSLECTPASGQGQAADLTICRACSCSNLTGLRYPSAEWSRLLL